MILHAVSIAVPILIATADPAPAPPAPPAPSAEEIRKVTNYYLNGAAGGPVLMELITCKKTGKSADGKLACEEKHADTAKKGDPLIAFVRFFVPKGAKYDDLKVKFLWNGEARSTSDFTLQESLTGYANYKQTNASKPGTWELQVLRGDTVVATNKIVVVE